LKSKLTLRLDKDVIEIAKEYSSKRGEPVSKLVEKFFKTIAIEEEEITPTVRKLIGILKDSNVDELDYKKYLEEKYL